MTEQIKSIKRYFFLFFIVLTPFQFCFYLPEGGFFVAFATLKLPQENLEMLL
jgi:hypothetical protein